MVLAPGRSAAFDHVVTEADTAAALGSGDLPVLGTPKVLALLERASAQAVASELPPGATTVGVEVALVHLAACPVGARVQVSAELTQIAGRRLLFATRLRHGDRPIASGQLTRALVDRAEFLGAISSKA